VEEFEEKVKDKWKVEEIKLRQEHDQQLEKLRESHDADLNHCKEEATIKEKNLTAGVEKEMALKYGD
jgi:hypothetical protein